MAASPLRYVPTVGPKLKILLYMVFGTFAILGATGVYLGGVSALNWVKSPQDHTTPFSLWMFLAHTVVGMVGTVPFLLFGAIHYVNAHKRTNRVAVRTGVWLLILGAAIIASGFALVQLEGLPQLPTGTISRSVVYWLHVLVPVACIGLYVRHRKAGPRIKWGYAIGNTVVEIWQCDNGGAYLHSGTDNAKTKDKNFQGFGRFTTNKNGEYYFRTIKPVPYPGRTPHIHFKIKRSGKEALTTQMYIKGEKRNEKDGVFMGVRDAKSRDALCAEFTPIKESKIGELAANFNIVLGVTPESR